MTVPRSSISAVIVCALAIGAASAQQAANTQPAPNGSMQEMMKRMMLGEEHKLLAKMAGKWTGRLRIWSSAAPTQPPLESTTELEGKLMLGGRFVQTDAVGSLMRMPMQRISILGYDNLTRVYTLIFYSSLETSTNIATGAMEADGKTLTLRGEFYEPQGKYGFKNVIRMDSDDVHVFESYRVMPDGTELKLVEEITTRVK